MLGGNDGATESYGDETNMNAGKVRGLGLVSDAALASTGRILVLASEVLINDVMMPVDSSVEEETRCNTRGSSDSVIDIDVKRSEKDGEGL